MSGPALPRRRLRVSVWPADDSDVVLETTVGGMLREAAAEAPDRVALVEGIADAGRRRRWTYAELLADAERCAGALLRRVDPGDRVAVWAPNLPEWVILEYAAALAGVVLVTVNPALRAREVAHVLGQSEAAAVVMVGRWRGDLAGTLEAIRGELPRLRHVLRFEAWAELLEGAHARALPAVRPGDIAQIQYTSGTTGLPKGALLHHRGITNIARMYAARLQIGADSVLLNPMPLFHTGGCVLAVLGAVSARATHILVPAFEPGLMLELAESGGATQMGAVPTMLVGLLDHPEVRRRDLSRLEMVVSGGAPVPAPLARRARELLGARVCIVYGCTECSPLVTQTLHDDSPEDTAETLGPPMPCIEVRIADPLTCVPLPVDSVGEIQVRGFNVMAAYNAAPEQTAAVVTDDGWYRTGDLGAMDERGYCRIAGRLKDMIIRGGENISPGEVEDVLHDHPAVAEAAVVGLPDERWGEVVAAFVRPAPAPAPRLELGELVALCEERLAPFKRPAVWELVDALPTTASGKVQKFALRERWQAGRVAAAPGAEAAPP